MIPLVFIPLICILLMYIFHLFEEEDLKPPYGLHIESFKGSKVQIAWNPMIFDDILDKQILVNIWSSKMNTEYILDPDTTRALVSFMPNAENFITVSVKSSTKCGKPSDVFVFQPPVRVIPMPVKIDVHQLGNSSVLLIWGKPEITFDDLKGYSIQYYDYLKSHEKRLVVKSNDNEVRYKISGLTQGVLYNFVVSAISILGLSEPIRKEIILQPHMSSKPGIPTFECEIVETDLLDLNLEEPSTSSEILTFIDECKMVRKKALKVIWLPDLDGNPGDRFSVQYRRKGEKIFRCSTVEEDTDFVVLLALTKNVHEIFVTSMDGSFSNDSEIREVCLM